MNPDGTIKRIIIPDKYLRGKTFDNESLNAPQRTSCLQVHCEAAEKELVVMHENHMQEDVRLVRDQAVKDARRDKI